MLVNSQYGWYSDDNGTYLTYKHLLATCSADDGMYLNCHEFLASNVPYIRIAPIDVEAV
jgi:hypothetical protein